MESQKRKGFSSLLGNLFLARADKKDGLPLTGDPGNPGKAPESGDGISIEVMSGRERDALSREENRRALHEAAVSCIRKNDISQQEVEFSRQYHLNEARGDAYDLRPLCNPDIFGQSAALFAPYAEKEVKPPYGNQMIGLLAGMLKEMGSFSVEPVDYTQAQEIEEKVPRIMRQGLAALTLRKVVHGPLRDQVNGYLILNEGIDIQAAQTRWKQLDALAGARNGAIDILKCYSGEAFVSGGMPKGREDWHQVMSDCCCSLHFFKEMEQKGFMGVPVQELSEAQAAYMGIGGDYRAFFEAGDGELSGFLKGEQGAVRVTHRPDYLSMKAQAENERRKTSLARLEAEGKAKTERRLEVENREKNTSLYRGGVYRGRDSGRTSGNPGLPPPASHHRR